MMKERMSRRHKTRHHAEAGIALLIAIFVLLLVSVVAIALLVSSGTETALGANYRASSTVYYAAMAGLEEARGRLLPRNPDYFPAGTVPSPFPLGKTVYVLNRLPGENVTPWDNGNPYYDQEYKQEFNVEASSAAFSGVSSVWDNNARGIPGPVYKWVRINAATEQSLFLDVNWDGSYDTATPIYYDPAHLDSHNNPAPSLIVTSIPPPTAVQVLEVTALASLPNGSQKMLQYVVAPISPNLTFPAALTLAGNDVTFSGPASSSFAVDGNDHAAAGICTPGGSPPPVAGVGYTNNTDSSRSNIFPPGNGGSSPGIPSANVGHYIGLGGSTPNVSYIGPSLSANLQGVASLESLTQTITENADVILSGGLTQSDASNHFPSWMSSTTPATIVVNGDFTFNGWHNTGYGLLLVTGKLTWDPDASWDGLILVIGKGVLSTSQLGGGQLTGAVFLATTVDSSGNPLPTSSPLGAPFFDVTNGAIGSGYSTVAGVYYSSCLVQWVQRASTYKVLSFHEVR